MRIIDKNKDFYDYLQGVYGMDEKVVYDRRGSTVIDQSKPWCGLSDCLVLNVNECFKDDYIPSDKKRSLTFSLFNGSVAHKFGLTPYKRAVSGRKELVGTFSHFCIEIGYKRHFFEVERYYEDHKLHLNRLYLGSKECSRKERLSDAPINYAACQYNFTDKEPLRPIVSRDKDVVKNPILANTWLTKFLNPDEIWIDLYAYISSLLDKEPEDTRTDVEHAESHGFDRKESFRNTK